MKRNFNQKVETPHANDESDDNNGTAVHAVSIQKQRNKNVSKPAKPASESQYCGNIEFTDHITYANGKRIVAN